MTLSLAKRKYAYLIKKIRQAGYHVQGVRIHQGWDWMTCSSKFKRGFTGLILCVSRMDGEWYFNTMHPYHYRIRRSHRVSSALIAVLSQDERAKRKRKPFPSDDIIQIDYREFEGIVKDYRERQLGDEVSN